MEAYFGFGRNIHRNLTDPELFRIVIQIYKHQDVIEETNIIVVDTTMHFEHINTQIVIISTGFLSTSKIRDR